MTIDLKSKPPQQSDQLIPQIPPYEVPQVRKARFGPIQLGPSEYEVTASAIAFHADFAAVPDVTLQGVVLLATQAGFQAAYHLSRGQENPVVTQAATRVFQQLGRLPKGIKDSDQLGQQLEKLRALINRLRNGSPEQAEQRADLIGKRLDKILSKDTPAAERAELDRLVQVLKDRVVDPQVPSPKSLLPKSQE